MELMSIYNIILLVMGIALFGAALYPIRMENKPLSLPILFLILGMILGLTVPQLPELNPMKYSHITERLTELAVIISLTTAGLKIDRIEGWRRWNSTWRLLGITMPLCIAAMAFSGSWLLGLPIGVAILLGAVTAPTDPVLASDVQVGPPGGSKEHEVRFSLTSEAGLNDALAFPFVNLALVLSASEYKDDIMHWLTIDVLWKIFAGIVMGLLIGMLAGKIVKDTTHISTGGFVALALTLFAYGATETVHGYGFLGVFVAARAFKYSKNDKRYFQNLHIHADQLEKMLMTVLMIMLGISVAQGLLSGLTWPVVLIALLFLLVIRPLSGLLGLFKSNKIFKHRAIIAFYGIRGIGSMYYLAYAVNHSEIGKIYGELLWSLTALIILISVFIHGVTVSFMMKKID